MWNSLKATIEWRIIASLIDFVVVYIWTGELWIAGGLTITLIILKSITFFLWHKIRNPLYF